MLLQELDIAGSINVDNARDLGEESSGLGSETQSGTGDTIGGAAPNMTLADAGATFTAADVGRYITLAGATTGANNGTFLISSFTDANNIGFQNASGVAEAFPGTWSISKPYSIEDDINFARTDRKNIKGTASHVTDIPTYERPTAVGTSVDANLTNIAGKTTDAMALVENRRHAADTVAEGDTDTTITDAGNMQYADAVDRTGIPMFDGADAGDHLATYVEIIDPTTEAGLEVKGYAVGEIDTDSVGAAVVVLDTETFVLNDGVNPAVTFEFDDNSSVTESATLRQVDITAAADEDDVRDAIITAINNAPTLDITAEANGAGIVKLTNDTPGTAGNQTITETVVSANFTVSGMAGGTADYGKRIYGRTVTGGTEPDSAQIDFRAVANGAELSTSVAYTWERDQPTTVDLYYGYRNRLDNLSETALRRMLSTGIVADADMAQDIVDIRSCVGIADGDQHLGSLLTNTGVYYIFNGLDATPDVVEALNEINQEIGDRNYTGTVLTDGETITESLQALSDAIGSSSVQRTIERLSAAISANTAHTLPGGLTYTLDGTDNGRNMWVFWRGLLKDPGVVADGDDYEETSTTQITPYTAIANGNHINYMIYQ
jgi:hypothetical protein